MSERQPGFRSAQRLSQPAPRLRRLRVMTSGRWHPPRWDSGAAPPSFAVGAAQPGVGKSIVASNLAAAIAGPGTAGGAGRPRPWLAAPARPLFGLDPPAGGLAAWLERKRARRDELAARHDAVRNLRLLPSIEPAVAPLSAGRRRAIVDELYDLETDDRRRRGHRQRQPRRPVRMFRDARDAAAGHVAHAGGARSDVRVPGRRGGPRPAPAPARTRPLC